MSSIEDKIKNAIVSSIKDNNNRSPWNKLNEESLKSIQSHIDSFNPCVSHYRRAHAPNMRWKQHNANHSKDTLNLSSNTCNVCKKYEVHLELYTQARSLYESHKKELNNDSKLTVSVDLQKVIMLPRMECFKAAIFTKRKIVFNESVVPIGKKIKLNL